jgi:hypothetical protein
MRQPGGLLEIERHGGCQHVKETEGCFEGGQILVVATGAIS